MRSVREDVEDGGVLLSQHLGVGKHPLEVEVEVEGAGRLLGDISPQVGIIGLGGCTFDISAGCLEGVDLGHFKPWLVSFYRPYHVSKRLPAVKQYRAKKSEGCRVVAGV